jgi:hypothetical protein
MTSIRGYVFLAKNRTVSTSKPGERPTFPGPLLSQQVRAQVLHVLWAAVGSGVYADQEWERIVNHYDYEMGTKNLGRNSRAESAVEYFIEHTDGVEQLDLIALALLYAEQFAGERDVAERQLQGVSMRPATAIDEVNRFLQEGDVPYRFELGQWVYVPSGYVHKEIVRPALDALDRPGFEGALDEFRTALEHARDGKTKEAATEATKALESTMKCICVARGLAYPASATAKPLFDILADKDLIPTWMERGFMGPVDIRNKSSAHGQGVEPKPLPPHMAALAVNLAASYIVALIAAHDS